MRNLFTLFLLFIGSALSVHSQVLFSEDFQSGIPNTFTMYDEDGNTVTQNLAQLFSDPWNPIVFTSDRSNVIAASTSSYTPAGTSDDWLITPQLNLQTLNASESYLLFFETRSGNQSNFDSYEVRLSTTGTAVSDFDTLLLTVIDENNSWTSHTIDLSGFDGQNVYIAWRNITTDGVILALDDILLRKVVPRDLTVSAITIDDQVTDGEAIDVTGEVTNVGSQGIQSFDLNWRINGGTVNTETIGNLNIGTNQTYSFTASADFTATNPGSFSDIEVWTSNPNGMSDQNNLNDSLEKQVFVNLGNSVQRNVLLEEFATVPCGWCPDGTVVVDRITDNNPEVIAVGIHACFGTDAMTNPEASEICNTLGNNSAPTAMIDRFRHEGDDEPAHSRTLWESRTDERLNIGSPLTVNITGTYDTTNRQADLTIDANFVDYPIPGDINVSFMILEDRVIGSGSGYDQRNFLNNQAGHPYAGAGDPIIGYPHRHVLRDILPSTFGDNSIIPSTITINNTYSRSFDFQLNNSWDEEQTSLVAVVGYTGSTNADYEVLNSTEVKLIDWITGIEKVALDEASFKVYPNPSREQTNLTFELSENQQVEVEVYDLTGKLMTAHNFGTMVKGNQLVRLDVSDFSTGFYFVKLIVGESQVSKKISVIR